MSMIKHIIDKVHTELYLLMHPALWGRDLQINGIPTIGNIENLVLGRDVSINSNCYIQCVGGGRNR